MTTATPPLDPPLRVRPASRADAAAVVAMVHELCAHEGDPTGNFTRETFEREGCGEGAAFALLLAERGGEALGYIQLQPAYDNGFALRGFYVSDLYVRPAARRQGIGRALLAATAQIARANGIGYLWLTAQTRNTGAHAFYRTLATVEETVVAFAIAGPDLDRLAAG